MRTYLVRPNFFEGSSLKVTIGATTDTAPTSIESVSADAEKALTDKGIRFRPAPPAVFLPGSSKLVVRDTPRAARPHRQPHRPAEQGKPAGGNRGQDSPNSTRTRSRP
ncbi:MAG: hypothetical protein WDO13_07730 [Verrucomicrobiota bacterium]